MEDEFNEYYILKYYDRLLTQYLNTLYHVGLDRKDYKDICKIVRGIEKIRNEVLHKDAKCIYFNGNMNNDCEKEYLNEIENIRGHFEKILYLIRTNIKPSTIEEYLQEEVSITHLVFTNNKNPKIKLYSDDGFMFLCQYHHENTPSLGVVNYKGYGKCFGCGWSFKVLSYIKYMERLSHLETLSLLSKVYMIDIKNNNMSDDNELIKKYRDSLLSVEYRSLLERAYERTSKREPNMMNSLALAKLDRDIDTIDRVSRGEHIKFDEEVDRGKRLKLSL